MKTHKSVLLYGPPGTGKTMLAKSLVDKVDVYLLQSTDFLSSYYGASEK